jgi:hypothetical protein
MNAEACPWLPWRFFSRHFPPLTSKTLEEIELRIRRTAAAAVTAGALALGGGVLSASEAHASTMLGGVSVANGCIYQLIGNAAVVVANNVYGWRCAYHGAVINVTYSWGPSLNQECAREYGSGAFAGYLDYNNPYSWRCYR